MCFEGGGRDQEPGLQVPPETAGKWILSLEPVPWLWPGKLASDF